MGIKYILPLLLLLSPSLYSADAVIEGQSKVKAGVQFVLDGANSVGDHFQWVVDPKIEELEDEYQPVPMICGSRFGLSLVTTGEYYFLYIASDASGISVATHKVTVSPWEDTGPGPGPGPGPVPPPSSDYTKLKKVSDQKVQELRDPVTADRLATALSQVEAQQSVQATAEVVRQAVERVLLTRSDQERATPWIEWRLAVNQEIASLAPSTPSQYLTILDVLISSLQESPPAAARIATRPSLRVYTRTNCSYCNLWKQVEYPKMVGWDVQFVTSQGAVPRFQVGNKVYSGYMTADALKALR